MELLLWTRFNVGYHIMPIISGFGDVIYCVANDYDLLCGFGCWFTKHYHIVAVFFADGLCWDVESR